MSEWISVEDRLPGKGDDVQVYCSDTKEQMVGFSLGYGGRFQFGTYPIEGSDLRGMLICRPTHWMPLPEPPTDKEQA